MSACPHLIPIPFDHRLSTFDLAVLTDEFNDLPCEMCLTALHESTGLSAEAAA